MKVILAQLCTKQGLIWTNDWTVTEALQTCMDTVAQRPFLFFKFHHAMHVFISKSEGIIFL